jgi:hypothetical protein
MIFTLKELREHPQTSTKDGSWHPAKPIGWLGMRLKNRIRAAWIVLKNDGVVVRWY